MKSLLLCTTLLAFISVNAQIESGMVAHFHFNNNTSDLSNSSIVATNNGGTFGPDRNAAVNGALVLDGSSHLNFNNSAVKTALPISMSAWVKFNSFGAANMIFSSDNVYGNWHGYGFNVISSGQVVISIHGGLGNQGTTNRRSFVSNQALLTGEWYHIVGIIRDYDDMSIYIDCIDAAGTYSGTGATSILYSSTESRIGNSIDGPVYLNYFLNGSIDQLVIWDREITPTEVAYMCDINNTLEIEELVHSNNKELIKVVDFMGREIKPIENTPLIYMYSDGTTERVFKMN